MVWIGSRFSTELDAVSRAYAARHHITRTPGWLTMKIAEEAGELVRAFLAATGQGRARGKSPTELQDAVDAEIADVICHALLLAHHRGTDVHAATNRKWLHRNDTQPTPAPAQSAAPSYGGRGASTPVRILDRAPTVTEYQQLRTSVGWNTPCTETCASALAASLLSVIAEIDSTAGGMARVIGDGVFATVVDVLVAPQHQHQRIGVAMMTRVNLWAATSAILHIGLVADNSVATWYQQWLPQPTGRLPALSPSDDHTVNRSPGHTGRYPCQSPFSGDNTTGNCHVRSINTSIVIM